MSYSHCERCRTAKFPEPQAHFLRNFDLKRSVRSVRPRPSLGGIDRGPHAAEADTTQPPQQCVQVHQSGREAPTRCGFDRSSDFISPASSTAPAGATVADGFIFERGGGERGRDPGAIKMVTPYAISLSGVALDLSKRPMTGDRCNLLGGRTMLG